ncbi:MAG: T9SS type A sorting domain-containing protein [Bacteroidales bacterium]|jgi:hypothetical protein|nr:T9SS type A sorting domain-containing protein [Bacteroidales bacterium]
MKKELLVLFSGLFIFTVSLQAQVASLQAQEKIVAHTTLTQTFFSVPTGTKLDLLTNLDLARMEKKDQTEWTEKRVKDLKIEITRLDLSGAECLSDSLYKVGKSVSNASGIRLYNFHDELMRYEPFDTPERRESYHLSEEAYAEYGFAKFPSQHDLGKISEKLSEAGYAVSYPHNNDNRALKAYSDSVEIYYSLPELLFEISYFHKKELQSKISHQYMKGDGVITPYLETRHTFYYSVNNIRVTRIDQRVYLNYLVEENGKTVYERALEKPQKSRGTVIVQEDIDTRQENCLKVYPNPATDRLVVEVPLSASGKADIEILNMQGVSVLKKRNVGKSAVSLNVSGLQGGVHIVRCVSGGTVQSVKFVKK